MKTLEKKLIRYRLIDRHIQLVKGSTDDMQVARRLLHFLSTGEIRLGLGDVDWAVEQELENAGVHLRYSSRGYSAYAHINWHE